MQLPPPAGRDLVMQPVFPVAIAQVQLNPDPLDLARQVQAIVQLRGKATGNPAPGCAWTGDLHGCWQLQHHPDFHRLVAQLVGYAHSYLLQLGFDRDSVALHLQRCWPVLTEPGQVVGRHHHPNAHLSAVYYLSGDGGNRCGCLRFWPHRQVNELVPGLVAGHGHPLAATPWTQPWVDVAPRAGLLLLFPSCLDHAVLLNEDEDALRCSLSLDFALTASAGLTSAALPEYLAPHPSRWTAVSENGTLPN